MEVDVIEFVTAILFFLINDDQRSIKTPLIVKDPADETYVTISCNSLTMPNTFNHKIHKRTHSKRIQNCIDMFPMPNSLYIFDFR